MENQFLNVTAATLARLCAALSVPLLFTCEMRRKMERAFDADFSAVKLFESVLPRLFGAEAFTFAEQIYFAPGIYRPWSVWGRAILGHELTHILQQRHCSGVHEKSEENALFLVDQELEEEALHAGWQAAARGRVKSQISKGGSLRAASRNIIQPIILNVGHDAFGKEFRKYNGWIVAKDVYLAYLDSQRKDSRFLEFDLIAAAQVTLGTTENIYLEGHGRPGSVGVRSPQDIAGLIVKFTFPDGYTGKIRAFCCSAGIGPTGSLDDSGVAELAAALSGKGGNINMNGVRITGAAGVAINCGSYANNTRVLQNDQTAQKRVFAEIDKSRGPVDVAWEKWITTHLPPIILKGGTDTGSSASPSDNTLLAAAEHASDISKTFYADLESSCKNDLIASGKDLTTKRIVVPQAQGSCILF